MQMVCVTTIPNDPWLGKIIEDRGDVLLVEDDIGIVREIPITECEVLDEFCCAGTSS